uniref:Uncharacterized protein n=1 Tax=Anguilla anguilla TaxID=7936 RepID=A0A0E9RUK4_ANGAN
MHAKMCLKINIICSSCMPAMIHMLKLQPSHTLIYIIDIIYYYA